MIVRSQKELNQRLKESHLLEEGDILFINRDIALRVERVTQEQTHLIVGKYYENVPAFATFNQRELGQVFDNPGYGKFGDFIQNCTAWGILIRPEDQGYLISVSTNRQSNLGRIITTYASKGGNRNLDVKVSEEADRTTFEYQEISLVVKGKCEFEIL